MTYKSASLVGFRKTPQTLRKRSPAILETCPQNDPKTVWKRKKKRSRKTLLGKPLQAHPHSPFPPFVLRDRHALPPRPRQTQIGHKELSPTCMPASIRRRIPISKLQPWVATYWGSAESVATNLYALYLTYGHMRLSHVRFYMSPETASAHDGALPS